MRLILAILAGLLVTGCGGNGGVEAAAAKPTPMWQTVIRDADRQRLAGLWGAWTRSLNQAETAGMRASVTALGDLAVPDAARPGAMPAAGRYLCRRVRLGMRDDGTTVAPGPAMMADAPAACSITERRGLLWFEQAGGGQRVGGNLFADGDRMVFLGSMALAGEAGLMAYGVDGDRDQVGVLRKIGDDRWRLELPWPMWQSNLEIIEIVPA